MKIYVSNFPFWTTQDDLRTEFEAYGKVISAEVIKIRNSGRSRGFGFVEMPDEDEANAAIRAIDGKAIGGRKIRAEIARVRNDQKRKQGDKRQKFKKGSNNRVKREEGRSQ